MEDGLTDVTDNSVHHFTICIAGMTVRIHSLYSRAFWFCYFFLSNKSPDFEVSISDQDLQKEQSLTSGDVGRFLGSCLEPAAVHRRIVEKAIDYCVVLMHGAVIAVNDQACLFTAPSGTGKTTHIRKWLDHLPSAFVVNGDKPFIKINDDGSVLACGSPWAGKENMYTNTMVPLKAIVLMERAEENHIEQISFAQAFPTLLQQTYRPDDAEKMRKTLRLMQRLSPSVSFWRFQCNNFKDDCFDVAYNALVGKQP